jgi:hypothetical protein
MKRVQGIPYLWAWILVLAFVWCLASSVSAQSNDVLGEVQFEGKTNVEKTSGVWVDGQYVGYINELKLSKKVLLLPGDHTISVRQNNCCSARENAYHSCGHEQSAYRTDAP